MNMAAWSAYLIDMNVPNMKTSDAKEKKFRELSDEELEKVTGGFNLEE